jgi:UDP-N-acetylglucosamine 2-epimerase
MQVVSIVGARPRLIKAAALNREVKSRRCITWNQRSAS